MDTPNFRLAVSSDLVTICDILNQAIAKGGLNAFSGPVDLNNRQRWLANHVPDKYPVYVLTIQQQVVGWLSYSPYRAGRDTLAGVTEIAYYLHHDWQGKGLGKQMLQFLIVQAPKLGFTHLLAILMDTNIASKSLLQKFGFEQWGHLPNIAQLSHQRAGQWYYGRAVL